MRAAILSMFLGLYSHAALAYTLRFEGNSELSTAALMKALAGEREILDSNFRETSVDDAAFMLENHYRVQGFPDAVVTFGFSASPPEAVFVIDEGPVTSIGALEFPGMTQIPPDGASNRLRELSGTTAGGSLRFVQSDVEKLSKEIQGRYEDLGHLAVTVHPEITSTGAAIRDVRVRVTEGPAYKIRRFHLTGDVIAPEEIILGSLKARMEDPFTKELLLALETGIRSHYQDAGYYGMELTSLLETNAETGAVDLVIQIRSGPEYRIGTVTLDLEPGARSRPGAIRHRLRLTPGTIFKQSRVDRAMRRLLRTGAFGEIRMPLTPNPDQTLDVLVQLREARAKQFSVSAGYGTWEGARGSVGFSDSNLLGYLLRAKAELFVSQKTFGGEVSLADTQWLAGLVEAEWKGFYTDREQPGYSVREVGTSLTLERRWQRGHSTDIRLLHKEVLDTSSPLIGVPLPPPEYTLGSVALGHRLDRRNDRLTPTNGFYLEGRVELATPVLLGDLEFLRWGGRATWYRTLARKTTFRTQVPFLMVTGQFGAVQFLGTDKQELPLQERFYNGGATTVRSFAEDELGPRDRNGTPVGGNTFTAITLELQVPVRKNVYLALFTDAGTLTNESTPKFLNDTRQALGVGLRYYTPIGALRVDYGWNPSRKTGEDTGALHFSLGVSF